LWRNAQQSAALGINKLFNGNRQIEAEADRAGRLVLLAAARNDEAVEDAATAPFLYQRLRARIAEEDRRRGREGNWLSLVFVARRAIPAMALIAILAAILTVWSIRPNAPATFYSLDEAAFADNREPGVEQTIITKNGLSREEVFNLVVDHSEREKR
jgi:hypothetical protein